MVRAVLQIGSKLLLDEGLHFSFKSININANIKLPNNSSHNSNNNSANNSNKTSEVISSVVIPPDETPVTSGVAYRTAKTHFHMGVQSKEYRLMGSAFVETLKYVFTKENHENPDEIKELIKLWQCIFSHVLLDVMKYARAMEMIYSPELISSSSTTSSCNLMAASVMEGAKSFHGSTFFDDTGNGNDNGSNGEMGGVVDIGSMMGGYNGMMRRHSEEVPDLEHLTVINPETGQLEVDV